MLAEAVKKILRFILRFLLRDRILGELSLNTFRIEMECILDNRPLTPVTDSPDDVALLTPVALLSGCIASPPPPDVFIEAYGYRRSWRAVQLLSDFFWQRRLEEYLPFLQQRQKWINASAKSTNRWYHSRLRWTWRVALAKNPCCRKASGKGACALLIVSRTLTVVHANLT